MLQGCDASFPRNMGGLGPHIRASRHAPPVDSEWAKETDDDCGRYSLSLLFPCASFYYSLVSTSGGIMKFSSKFFFSGSNTVHVCNECVRWSLEGRGGLRS